MDLEEKILKLALCFCGILLVLLIALLPVCIIAENNYEKEIKDCFMQEVKTKDCKFKLWKYENRNRNKSSKVIPMPMIIR